MLPDQEGDSRWQVGAKSSRLPQRAHFGSSLWQVWLRDLQEQSWKVASWEKLQRIRSRINARGKVEFDGNDCDEIRRARADMATA